MAKILVVDDEQDSVALIQLILERDGHVIAAAYDGEACIAQANADKPDLIVLDVMMPVVDGYTAAQRLLENPQTASIPILILTAKEGMKDVFNAGNIADYMQKPFDPHVLRARIKTILEQRTVR